MTIANVILTLESGEPPSRTLNWNPLGFLSHIKRRTNDDRFPLSLWEVWFYSTLGVPIPGLIGPSHRCVWNVFHYTFWVRSVVNIKGSVGLILAKSSAMRISIPLDLSSRPFIPPPRFLRSRRPIPLLATSLVFTPRLIVLV